MARGSKKPESPVTKNGLPKFVDVPLTAEHKADFKARTYTSEQLVGFLCSLCDDGYRVGCTWAAEQQAYTVSLTCRDDESPNNGLCMTSFAKELTTAVALAMYKHEVVTEGRWTGVGSVDGDDFG